MLAQIDLRNSSAAILMRRPAAQKLLLWPVVMARFIEHKTASGNNTFVHLALLLRLGFLRLSRRSGLRDLSPP